MLNYIKKLNIASLTKLLISICKTKRVRDLKIVLMERAVNFTVTFVFNSYIALINI